MIKSWNAWHCLKNAGLCSLRCSAARYLWRNSVLFASISCEQRDENLRKPVGTALWVIRRHLDLNARPPSKFLHHFGALLLLRSVSTYALFVRLWISAALLPSALHAEIEWLNAIPIWREIHFSEHAYVLPTYSKFANANLRFPRSNRRSTRRLCTDLADFPIRLHFEANRTWEKI